MKTLAIVNPQSGDGWARKRKEELFSSLRNRIQNVEIIETRAPGDALRIARDLDQDAWSTVIAAGGDGTIHEVVNGLIHARGEFPLRVNLGVLCLGRGCDYARTLNVPRRIDQALNIIKDGRVRHVDVGRAISAGVSKYFVNSCSYGLGGSIAAAVQAGSGLLPKFLAYPAALVKGYLSYKPTHIKVEVEGRSLHNGNALNVFVCNGRYSGEGMYWAPEAQLDDGNLNVVLIKEIPLSRFVRALPRIYGGSIQQVEGVAVAVGRQVALTCEKPLWLELDGETLVSDSVRIDVLNGILPVLVP